MSTYQLFTNLYSRVRTLLFGQSEPKKYVDFNPVLKHFNSVDYFSSECFHKYNKSKNYIFEVNSSWNLWFIQSLVQKGEIDYSVFTSQDIKSNAHFGSVVAEISRIPKSGILRLSSSGSVDTISIRNKDDTVCIKLCDVGGPDMLDFTETTSQPGPKPVSELVAPPGFSLDNVHTGIGYIKFSEYPEPQESETETVIEKTTATEDSNNESDNESDNECVGSDEEEERFWVENHRVVLKSTPIPPTESPTESPTEEDSTESTSEDTSDATTTEGTQVEATTTEGTQVEGTTEDTQVEGTTEDTQVEDTTVEIRYKENCKGCVATCLKPEFCKNMENNTASGSDEPVLRGRTFSRTFMMNTKNKCGLYHSNGTPSTLLPTGTLSTDARSALSTDSLTTDSLTTDSLTTDSLTTESVSNVST